MDDDNILDINPEELLDNQSFTHQQPPGQLQQVPQLPIMNSSVITDKIEIQRLKGSNWATWKWQLQNVLDSKGLTSVLTSDEPRGSPREVAARQIISGSLDQSLICKVIHCQTVQQIWSCLRGIYENRTSFAKTDLIGRMNSFKMSTLDDVENGISEIQSLACQIQALGGIVDDAMIESAILRALPSSFASFVAAWTFQDAEKRTLENLHAHLMRTVSQLRLYEAPEVKDKALAGRQVKGRGHPKSGPATATKNKDKKSSFCRYCKETGHVVKECLKLKKKKERDEKTQNSKQDPKPDDKSEGKPEHSDESPATARVAYGHIATSGESTVCLKSSLTEEHISATWIADSGASFHMTSHLEWIAGYQEFTDKISVKLGNDTILKAHGRGFIETTTGVLDPVFFLPDITENLFSVASCAKVHKIFALSTDTHIKFLKNNQEVFRGTLNNVGVYEINFIMKLAKYVTLLSTSLSDWHDRLAHVSPELIQHMAKNKVVEGMVISDNPKPKCEPCASGKSKRASHPLKSSPRSTVPGQILHFDTVGPMPELSLGNKLYYVLCKDSCSSYRQIFFVSSKADIPAGVKQIVSKAKLDTGNDTLKIITDNGSEYVNQNLTNFLNEHGIIHETSATYTPEQNGYIERDIRTVAEAAQSMRLRANLPRSFWAEAMSTSVYLLNRVVNSRHRDKTPFELWYNRKPSLNNIHKFGESAIVHVNAHARDKLDPKGVKMIFVGYTETFNTFRFVNPSTHELVISCNAIFLNQVDHREPLDNPREIFGDDTVSISLQNDNFNEQQHDDKTPSHEGSSRQSREENLTFSKHSSQDNSMDTEYSTSTSNRTFEVKKMFESPASMPPEHPNAERMSTLRPRLNNPNYCNWKINVTTLIDDDDPTSFAEAMQRPDKEEWLAAMKEELQCLKDCGVWTIVDKPPGKNVVSNRWVLRIKRNTDGNVSRYRARLVARGFSQVYGVDYKETYAPTASLSIIRLLLANAAVMKLKLAQFDIKTAFLYGDLNEEVYMSQPEGFTDGTKRVWRLNRSLYGLKQAPRQWCKKFTSFLLSLGLKSSVEDRCVFFQYEPLIQIVLYVDDGIIFAREQKDIDHILEQFRKTFNVHTMALDRFLGFQIKQQSSGNIILHQERYILSLLKKYKMDSLKSERSPISPSKLPDDLSSLDPDIPYREIVGSLLYAAVNTRIDIAYPVSLACRTVSNPTVSDWKTVLRVLQYLSGNPDLGLMYRQDRHEGLVTYCDAAFANDEATSRSTTGLIVMFGGAPISWRSSKQKIVTTSSTEAEIVSLCTAFKEAIWIYNFAIEVGILQPQPIRMLCDDTSSITLANSERSVQRTKHFRAKFAFLQEKTEEKTVVINHVSSANQLADLLTKA